MIRVLHYIGYPFAWAKGGHEIQIRETQAGMIDLGVEHHWLHHDAPEQPDANILHYWGRPPNDQHWSLAQSRGMKVVISQLHQQAVLRARWKWKVRGAIRPLLQKAGGGLYRTLGAGIYPEGDAAIAVTPFEAEYMSVVFGAPPERTHVIPNGVSDIYFDESVTPIPFEGLIYSAFISRRKNCLEVARAAKRMKVPVKFVGGASVDDAEYVEAFKAEIDNQTTFWTGDATGPEEIAAHLRGAKGLVLASRNEAVGLSALEAMACGIPVLISRLPNLTSYYGESVHFCAPGHEAGFEKDLKTFWENCVVGTAEKEPFDLWRWRDVSRAVYDLYCKILCRPET